MSNHIICHYSLTSTAIQTQKEKRRTTKWKKKTQLLEKESWKDGTFSRSYTLWRFPKRNAKGLSIFGFLHWFSFEEFTETLLQATESMRRTIWFDTGHGGDTNRWYDRDCLRKKREARRAPIHFQKTGLDADTARFREKKELSTNRQYRIRKSSTKLLSTWHF